MSLINEALRKARKEAAEKDAAARGTTYRPPRSHLPRRSSWLPALVGGVVLGSLVAAGAFFVLSSSETRDAAPRAEPSQKPTVASGSELSAETQLPNRSPNPPVGSEPPSPSATTARPNPTVTSEPAKATVPAEPPPPNQPPNPTVISSEPPNAPAAAETRRVQSPERTGEAGDRVYVLEAEIDGVPLRLDFIVWAPSSPFAQINGVQVSVGQLVDGFLVRSITREEVTLEGDAGAFRLRVR